MVFKDRLEDGAGALARLCQQGVMRQEAERYALTEAGAVLAMAKAGRMTRYLYHAQLTD